MSRPLWGLYRRPDGSLEVGFVHFCDGTPFRTFWEREDAVRAREAQEQADREEARRATGQRDLFGEEP